MIAEFLFRNPRILLPVIATIIVSGLSAYYILPRMEDPVLGKRVAVISTAFPGANTERVEALVTTPLESRLSDVAGIEEIKSTSRAGISNVVIELRDDVTDVEPVWSRVRDRLDDARADLPEQALHPEFERFELKAYAAIIAIRWRREDEPNLAILRRLAANLKAQIGEIPGTERVDLFGDPGEEIAIEVSADVLAGLGLSTGAIAEQVNQSESQQPAGLYRNEDSEILLDLERSPSILQSLGQRKIKYGREGRTTNLGDIATIRREVVTPAPRYAFADGERAVVLGVFVRDEQRVDLWANRLAEVLERSEQELHGGIEIDLLFSQREYIDKRHNTLLRNLLIGTLAVVAVVFLLMGWRSTIVVGTSLPLSALMVLTGMRAMSIPIHQMSVTGLIIALGLLIDNAIVIVDEVRFRIRSKMGLSQAIRDGVRHLAMPLFGSTLTTTLAFLPIATLPGPPGEFVGTIAVSVILAINSSFLLAMTVVPALTALLGREGKRANFLSRGVGSAIARRIYEKSLMLVFRYPSVGLALGAFFPLIGYLQAQTLPEQFFPASDRNQIQIEVELPARSSAAQTASLTESISQLIGEYEQVDRTHWFIGESAPTFFYNVVPRRRGTSFYAQAILDLQEDVDTRTMVRQLQERLDQQFAECRLIVRQLEQGPPFDAPVEIRLRGPDLTVLERLGSELRLILAETQNVIHTRSDMEETIPKIVLQVDEQETRLAGLSRSEIASQVYTSLEGSQAGTIADGFEAIPIRVRIADREQMSFDELSAFELYSREAGTTQRAPNPNSEGGTPLSALATLELSSEVGAITRIDGERMNEVKGYLRSGTLPSTVLDEFKERVAESDFELPDGYSMEFGGESAERNEAVGSLLANAVVIFALILLTLIISFRSFRVTLIIAAVGGLSIGLGPGALWLYGFPFGFMAIVGTMGLVGVAINDAIVVMAGIRANEDARRGNLDAMRKVVVERTRHVLATTLTTIAGFLPLVLGGGGFWPPMAITIAGGVGGATLLALYFVPSLYLVMLVPAGLATLKPENGQ